MRLPTSVRTFLSVGFFCRSWRRLKACTIGRPAFSSATSSWLKIRKSAILTRPLRARRGPKSPRPWRCTAKTWPPRRSISWRAATASAAPIDSSAIAPSGQPALTENCGLTGLLLLDWLDRLVLPLHRLLAGRTLFRLALRRQLLHQEDQDQGGLGRLVAGGADDERLVELDRHGGAVELHGSDPALLVLLHPGEREGERRSTSPKPDRPIVNEIWKSSPSR